jgi:hypothetical protein
MRIIEFFGENYAGKSFLFKKINFRFSQKTIFSFKTIFYYYLFKKKKISLIKYKIVKFLILNEVGKSQNFFIKIFSNFYFNIEQDMINEKEILFIKIKKKYNKFFNFYSKQIKNCKNRKKQKLLEKWIIDVLIGYYLTKKNYPNSILLTPEGIYQRIYSLYKRSLISKKNLKKLIILSPKIDKVFLIKNKKTINSKIKDMFELIEKKKIDTLTITNDKQSYKENLILMCKNLV